MKKKIVLLSAFLSPYRSGAEAMVEEVSARLGNEYDITIITGRYSRSLKKNDVLGKKVSVIRVGLGLGLDKWLFPFLAPMQVARLKPDIVHAVLETFAGLALYLSKTKAKKMLTLQTTNRSFLKGPIVRSPDIVTAISADLARIAKGFGRDDVIVIPNGIDLRGIREAANFHAKDSGRVLFVGRLESMKGVDVLLKAFAKAIKGLDPSVHLRVIGDGSLLQDLKKLVSDLDIDHRVTFTGRMTGKALLDEYAKAPIFCGLSRSEALGNVFLEAQAAGCAVLATNAGGIPETIKNGQNGILVSPDDIDAAAAELRKLLTDPGLRAKLSIAAQKNSETYGWDGVTKKYDEIYRSASSRRVDL